MATVRRVSVSIYSSIESMTELMVALLRNIHTHRYILNLEGPTIVDPAVTDICIRTTNTLPYDGV